MIYAPVMIPTLCRYEHFKECLESLSLCKGADMTEVFVGLDYPAKENHRPGYEKIKNYLEQVGNMNFKKIHVYLREVNYGGGKNSRELQNVIKERFDTYIYSEDDNVFSPNFLEYMNACLEKYKDDPDVLAVCGYSYPVKWDVSEEATILKQQINVSMWGTGLWEEKEEAWNDVYYQGILLKKLKEFVKKGNYRKMIDACLKEYMEAACNITGIGNQMLRCKSDISRRSLLAVYDKYAITPVITKVKNQGFDGSGLYCQKIDSTINGVTAGTYNYPNQPIDTSESFVLVEDTKNSSEINRQRLNSFDYRSPQQMAKAKRLLWLCLHLGIWSAKLYSIVVFPSMIAKKVLNKYLRK